MPNPEKPAPELAISLDPREVVALDAEDRYREAFMAMLEVLQAVERRLTIELHDCKHTNFPLSAALPEIRAALRMAETALALADEVKRGR